MKVLLVFPPFTDASQPNAAIPTLVAALKADGIRADVWDANLDFWEYAVDPQRQRTWLQP